MTYTASSLKDKLQPFFQELSYSDVRSAHRALSYLVLLGSVKLYDEMIFLFESEEHAEGFLKPVKATLTESYQTKNIWRAVLHSIRTNSSVEEASELFQVLPSDVYFVLEGLVRRDLSELCNQASDSSILLDPLSPKDLKTLLAKLGKFCKSLAYKKLRFLHTADNAVLMEDISGDLLTKALKMVRHYEHLSKDGKHDLLKIENYVKQGLTNHVTNLISFYTTKKRARIANITRSCGMCEQCQSGQNKRCSKAVQNFQLTTLRLDAPRSKKAPTAIRTTLKSGSQTPEALLEEKEFFQVMTKGLDPKVVEFLEILTDTSSAEGFEAWLEARDIQRDEVFDERKLANFAFDYLHLDKNYARKTLSRRFAKYGAYR